VTSRATSASLPRRAGEGLGRAAHHASPRPRRTTPRGKTSAASPTSPPPVPGGGTRARRPAALRSPCAPGLAALHTLPTEPSLPRPAGEGRGGGPSDPALHHADKIPERSSRLGNPSAPLDPTPPATGHPRPPHPSPTRNVSPRSCFHPSTDTLGGARGGRQPPRTSARPPAAGRVRQPCRIPARRHCASSDTQTAAPPPLKAAATARTARPASGAQKPEGCLARPRSHHSHRTTRPCFYLPTNILGGARGGRQPPRSSPLRERTGA
jgi:hypothetical protein